MRSVFFHLTNTSREEFTEWFRSIAGSENPGHWCFPLPPESPVLWIYFAGDLLLECEPEEIAPLVAILGGLPSLIVMVDVSSRVPGTVEVQTIAGHILRKYQGVAWDDHTTHCWTLNEILNGFLVEGHPFFDCEGWYQEGLKAAAAKS